MTALVSGDEQGNLDVGDGNGDGNRVGDGFTDGDGDGTGDSGGDGDGSGDRGGDGDINEILRRGTSTWIFAGRCLLKKLARERFRVSRLTGSARLS